jgi:hypothetical protein
MYCPGVLHANLLALPSMWRKLVAIALNMA